MKLEDLLKSLPDDLILSDGEEDWTPDTLLRNLKSTELTENVLWNGRSIFRGVSGGYVVPVPMYVRQEVPKPKRGPQVSACQQGF